MGLQKDLNARSGLYIPNAYFRVGTITGGKEGIDFSLVSYKSRNDFLKGKSLIEAKEYHFTPDMSDDAPNFIRQAYAHLKTIDNYEDAIDVLEEGQTPLEK